MKKKEDSEETFKTTFEQRVNLATSTDAPVFWDCLLPPNPSPNPSPSPSANPSPSPSANPSPSPSPSPSANPSPSPSPSPKQETKMEEKPIKIFTQDESRFGTKTVLRRRITIKGVKPIVKVRQSYENTYL